MKKLNIQPLEEIFKAWSEYTKLCAEFLDSVTYDKSKGIFRYKKSTSKKLLHDLKDLRRLCELRHVKPEGEVDSKFLVFDKVEFLQKESDSLRQFLALQSKAQVKKHKTLALSFLKDQAIRMWYCNFDQLRLKIYDQAIQLAESLFDERNKNLIQSMALYPFETDSDAQRHHRLSSHEAYEEAIRLLNRNIDQHFGQEFLAEEYSERGRIFFLRRDFEKARSDFNKALQVAVRPNWMTLHRMSVLLSEIEFYRESIEYDIFALGQNPFFAPCYNTIGVNQFFLGEYKLAQEYFQAASELDESNADYLSNLGFLCFCRGHYDESTTYLERALKIPESCPSVKETDYGTFNLGLAYFRKAQETKSASDLAEADKFFHRAFGRHKLRPRNLGIATSSWFMLQRISQMKTHRRRRKSHEIGIEKEEAAMHLLENLPCDVDNFITRQETSLSAFQDYLKNEPIVNQSMKFFRVLRRWNSYTPIVPVRSGNIGGGYFLGWKNEGIVIDPGFNFIRNLKEAGIPISDVDSIIITHAHIDHCIELESILTLIHERNKLNGDGFQSVKIYINRGAAVKYLSWLNGIECVESIRTLNPGDKIKISDHISLEATKALHSEVISRKLAVGVKLKLFEEGDKPEFTLGITSDTAYTPEIVDQYRPCDILVLHLGTVTLKELFYATTYSFDPDLADQYVKLNDRALFYSLGCDDKKEFEKVYHRRSQKHEILDKNHLGFEGIYGLLTITHPTLAVISEFGEELGFFKYQVAKTFDKLLLNERRLRCFTGDLNFDLDLSDQKKNLKLKCDICNRYQPIDRMNEICKRHLGNAMIYYCGDCKGRVDEKYPRA